MGVRLPTRLTRRCAIFSILFLYIIGASGRINDRASSIANKSAFQRQELDDQQPLDDHTVSQSTTLPSDTSATSIPPWNPLTELRAALKAMQSEYFELWLGAWPTSIDWTGAVVGTHVSASLFTLTQSLDYVSADGNRQQDVDTQGDVENEINTYFSQIVAYYFGENAFAIRNQAYDDMLWVVLGWLENLKFINLHSDLHYPPVSARDAKDETQSRHKRWYGAQFVESFAHRAHVFYDIASRGWDTKLCGGGMVWNPNLIPYKNAITNELFIAASVGMYLHFPGDRNGSPFVSLHDAEAAQRQGSERSSPIPDERSAREAGLPPARPYDLKYLNAAIEGYGWLVDSNMTNTRGLYVDGFHIHGWSRNGSLGTRKCDLRNEMVFTYNQGVLLSGLRGLWEATGDRRYLEDGHTLIRNVISATGWYVEDSVRASSRAPTTDKDFDETPEWHGLGRRGIIHENCDTAGRCSQDGQTFKGIFFHHFAIFCEPLPVVPIAPGHTHAANPEVRSLHSSSCRSYIPWVERNAMAAVDTRDGKGRFGGWWGAKDAEEWEWAKGVVDDGDPIPDGAVDYKNTGDDREATTSKAWMSFTTDYSSNLIAPRARTDEIKANDLNDRGRGRTVETQTGGVAVLRAHWELLRNYAQ